MRVPTAAVFANKAGARTPQSEQNVPFQAPVNIPWFQPYLPQEILPLRLKNRVSGKADSGKEVACLQEMTVLFACLKDNEFVEQYCNKEINQFKKCYKFYLDKNFEAKQTINQGIVTPGKNLNYKQLNKYMRLFPNAK